MLGKLLKYEMKATGRIILPFYGGLLGVTILFRVFSVFNRSHRLRELSSIIEGLSIMVFVILMISTFVVSFIIMLNRFYKNLFGDEGYLMHTLPVTPAKNIWAKALCSALWTVISVLVVSLTGFIFFFGDKLLDIGALFGMFWDQFIQMLPYLSATDSVMIVLALLLLCMIMLVGLVSGPIFCYLCITLGQRFGRHKVLGAFCVYLLITFLIQTVTAIGTALVGSTNLARVIGRMAEVNPAGISVLILVIMLLWSIFVTAAAFLITNHELKYKLNLE